MDGSLRRVPDDEGTSFAVVSALRHPGRATVQTPIEHEDLIELIDRYAGDATGARAVRIDGELDVHARSVPRQELPRLLHRSYQRDLDWLPSGPRTD